MAFDPRRYPNAFQSPDFDREGDEHESALWQMRALPRSHVFSAISSNGRSSKPGNSLHLQIPREVVEAEERARLRLVLQPTRPPDPPRRVTAQAGPSSPGAASGNGPHKPFFHDFRGYRSAAVSSCVCYVRVAAPVQAVTVAAYGPVCGLSIQLTGSSIASKRADPKGQKLRTAVLVKST